MAQSADKIVVTSMIVTVGSTTAACVMPTDKGGQGKFPPPRLLIGTGLSYLGLSILADFAPAIAGPLATGIALTALTYYGLPILEKQFGTKEK